MTVLNNEKFKKQYDDEFIINNIEKITRSILIKLVYRVMDEIDRSPFSYTRFYSNQTPFESMCNKIDLIVDAASKYEASFIFWVSRALIDTKNLSEMAKNALKIYNDSYQVDSSVKFDSTEEYFMRVVEHLERDLVSYKMTPLKEIEKTSWELYPEEWKIATTLHCYENRKINERVCVSASSLLRIYY